jgi:hypothetical protein
MRQRMNRIRWFMENPLDAQALVFSDLINSASDTVWGNFYNYKGIQSYDSFKGAVPLQDYESLKPYINRSIKGERDVLWPGKTKWFAKSSGTTSDRSKYIPITKEALQDCHYQSGRDVMTIYLENFQERGLFAGKGMVMGGSYSMHALNEDAVCGDLSAILMQNMPIIGEIYRVPKLDVALMDDWEEKLERLVEETQDEPLTNISGVPSWTLVFLRKALEKAGCSDVSELWPDLELFVHGGVSFTPYREAYKEMNSMGRMNYLEVYNASEGFISIQDQPDRDDMLLLLDNGIFYEFIPLNAKGEEKDRIVDLSGVEKGVVYAVVISTNGGLWRYQLGDTIEFIDLNPYRIKVSGRTKHFINVFGEELMVWNTDKALNEVCLKHQSTVRDYTVAPIFMEEGSKGGHEWLVEFDKEPKDLQAFVNDLDDALMSVNSDYAAKRSYDLALEKPKLHVLRPGSFDHWLKSKGKLGGQHKVPRLSNSREYLEDILKSLA